MTYQETIDWMFKQLPMYQRQGKTAFKKDLTNSLVFSNYLGNPHKKFKSIHVAGTNGKGSTSHMLAAILQASGYRVGLYTSPHLKDFRERIRVNGEKTSEAFVVNFIEKHHEFLSQQQLSFFEMTVGMAFEYFATSEVDIAIIEVGLGGRLDSTNIITPELAVITNIGLDHTQFLGETLPEIASEKAGIIKPEVPVVIGEYHSQTLPVFTNIAQQHKAPLIKAYEAPSAQFSTALQGLYQKHNVQTAVTAIRNLKGFEVTDNAIQHGLMKVTELTGLLGRWQTLMSQPKVICDTAHNAEGLTVVMQQLKQEQFKALHLVIGMVSDKNIESIIPLFPKNATYYFCKPNIPRGLNAAILSEKFKEFGYKGKVYATVSNAYEAALSKASAEDLIYVGGSTFVVAEII